MKYLFLLLLSVCAVQAREVRLQNLAKGPLVVSFGTGFFDLPPGETVLDLPDGEVLLTTTNGTASATVAGDTWQGVRIVVGSDGLSPVCYVAPFYQEWWYFGAGMAFMLPIVAFGFFSRIAKKTVQPMSEV
jgi:hypothetical protein